MSNEHDPAAKAAFERLEARKKALLEQKPIDAAPAAVVTDKPAAASVAEPAPVASPAAPVVVKEEPAAAVNAPAPGSEPIAGTIEWYRAETARYKKEKETLAGTLGAQIKNLKDEVALKDTRISELEAGGARAAKPDAGTDSDVLTAEVARKLMEAEHPGMDFSDYDADDLILFATPLWKQQQGASETNDALQRTVEEMQQRSNYDRFCMAVEASAPGFTAAQGNPFDGIQGDPGWAAFLLEPMVNGAKLTRGEFMTTQGTPAVMANWFKEYQLRAKTPAPVVDPNKPQLPSVEEQAAPAATARPVAQSEGTRYVRAAVTQFFDDLNNRRIPLNPENQKLFREYKLADLEGRID